jgi:peptide/nickel transport system ATP-binding protein
MPRDTLLVVERLRKHFPVTHGFLGRVVGHVKAVDDVSFDVGRGETLGLVGESGCGKTTTGRAIARALRPDGGKIELRLEGTTVDLASLSERDLKRHRRHVQLVFQDPYSSLNPRMNVRTIIGEPLLVNGIARGSEIEDRVAATMKVVGLRPEYMRRYPHAFSGGQRQRIGLARALILNPEFIVCDEPVSALDVSIQAQTLNLLQELQAGLHLTYLFISHDLGVIEHISDRVAVMYAGRIVEVAGTDDLFRSPKHPYTEALLSAVPKPDPAFRDEVPKLLQGEVPDLSNLPSGCHFHPRCAYAKDECRDSYPALRRPAGGDEDRSVACHFADTLSLSGIG